MLTKQDLLNIEAVVNKRVNPLGDKIEDGFEEIKQSTKLLPTKDEFFIQMDKLMGELKVIREERETQADVLSNHGDKLEKLLELHPTLQP